MPDPPQRDPEIIAMTAQIRGLATQIHALVQEIEQTVVLLVDHTDRKETQHG